MPGHDGESKGAHDEPLAIEHLEETSQRRKKKRKMLEKKEKAP